ncbi:MAG: type II CRISPR RNA-guided endonuclease Cas9 [Rhodospirillales bacterium]
MERVFGFDLGTTSIGFAVIDYDPRAERSRILQLGVRIFPESRDPRGEPLNQKRRGARLVRRQIRRRRQRRRALNEALTAAGLLPAFGTPAWDAVMAADPYALRTRGLTEALTPQEVGRALYHLAQRRHFKGRALEEVTQDQDEAKTKGKTEKEEEKTKLQAAATARAVAESDSTLGAWLAALPEGARRRGRHATRDLVQAEFAALITAQARHHPDLLDGRLRARLEDLTFAQKPVFWRKKTLGRCRFVPDAPLCAKGSWISQQRRMLETLNNLAIAGGNGRPLDAEERTAILAQLSRSRSMTWAAVRKVLKPLHKARGLETKRGEPRFNLETLGKKALPGNALEQDLHEIFGADWDSLPRRQALRDCLHDRLWAADYEEVGSQRVAIRPQDERLALRQKVAESFVADFGLSVEAATALSALHPPAGWEPFSSQAVRAFLPELEAGQRFGSLLADPDLEAWRDSVFPNRERPSGEVRDRLPSPAEREEQERLAGLRNPTVVRVQNELRKVVNNLVSLHGKPDRIRIELAREVGASQRQREERSRALDDQRKRRRAASRDLQEKGLTKPSRKDIEAWLLWEECGHRCPYSGDQIPFDALFGEKKRFEVEHIWPRALCLDDSFANKTLCRRDLNREKGNRIPYDYLGGDAERWTALTARLDGMMARKPGAAGLSPGKVKRFLAQAIPEDFASRQLNDTGFAARSALAQLKRLWPDLGPSAPVRVEAVSGRVTAHLRRLWGLNGLLGTDGRKTREDHRHHAVDALTVACCGVGATQRLSRYWQEKDGGDARKPKIAEPWPDLRRDAAAALAKLVVSHRVRRKVAGPLHEETVFGDTGANRVSNRQSYRLYVARRRVEELSLSDLQDEKDEKVVDPAVRETLRQWIAEHGGIAAKAFSTYPRLGGKGPEIRRVRVTMKQQPELMAAAAKGYVRQDESHHISLYRRDGAKPSVIYEVVKRFEAARRLAKRQAVVDRRDRDGARFWMSLCAGDTLSIPTEQGPDLWVVTGIRSSGQIEMQQACDAKGSTKRRRRPSRLLEWGATKVAVDPIGRILRAND